MNILTILSVISLVAADLPEERHDTMLYVAYYVGTLLVVVIVIAILIVFTCCRLRKHTYYGRMRNIIPSHYFANYALYTDTHDIACLSIQTEEQIQSTEFMGSHVL